MGASSHETVREIAEIREQLDADLDALSATLPPKETVIARLATAAVGGAITVLSLWFIGNRLRRRRQDRRIRHLVAEAIEDAQL